MKSFFNALFRYSVTYWNALLAASSLLGVAIFGLVPPLQQYVKVFIFIAANAVVWTLIEIKAELKMKPANSIEHFANMRIARASIVSTVEERLGGTTPESPLEISFIGGRLRSMSDIARELVDDLKSGRKRGHLRIHIFCLDPTYITQRCLPGGLSKEDQAERNSAYGRTVQSIATELRRVSGALNKFSSATIDVTHYSEDPHFYAYVIGDDCLFWGPYTYSDTASDFIGPENACFEIHKGSSDFQVLQSWLMSRMLLYSDDHRSPTVQGGGSLPGPVQMTGKSL